MTHKFVLSFDLTKEAADSGVERNIEDLFIFVERYIRHQPGITNFVFTVK